MEQPIRAKVAVWYRSRYGHWLRRIISWTIYALLVRFAFIGPFYNDNHYVKDLVAIAVTSQTIAIYYFFGYYVFPRYLYHLQILESLLWLFISHIIIYWTNYSLYWYLNQVNEGSRIERDWQLYQSAGWLGYVSSPVAATYSFFYSFPFALMFLGVLAVKNIIETRTRNLKLERDYLDLELSFLKAQVNPHFLFNTLNSVYGRVFETDEQAADLVLRLSELMRYNLYEANVPRIALEKELLYIQNYLDLERNRLLDENVLIEYEQKGEPTGYKIAPLLLIAFVENAFKHGVKGATKPSYVSVLAEIDNDELLFRIENSIVTGRSVSSEPTKKSGGLGLGNVRRRLENLYKGRYVLDIIPGIDHYEVVLRLKL